MRPLDRIALLSTLLILLSVSGQIEAGARKKIRIHIPQKVKHIHHHRKIYITQHKAPTAFGPLFASADHQYAPAFPAEATATATAIALLPLSDERRSAPPMPTTVPNLQPLYRARGHYGPTASTYSEEIKLPRPTEGKPSSKSKIKIIKVTEGDKKPKASKKKKTRIVINDEKDIDGVPSFHDEFYADVNSGIVKKIKKPKRVEKFIDGDTEHIHTYTEEHVHQFVFDQPPGKTLPGQGPAVFTLGGSSPLEAASSSHNLVPLDVTLHHGPEAGPYPTISSLRSHKDDYDSITNLGSLGTPSHMEYMGYEPAEATHDHLFHDHGEIVPEMRFTKGIPPIPKATYNSKGVRISPSFPKTKHQKPKDSWTPLEDKPKDSEYSSELIYAPQFKPKVKKVPNFTAQKFAGHDGEISLVSDLNFDDLDGVPHVTTYHGNSERKKNKRRPLATAATFSIPLIEVPTTKKPKTSKRARQTFKNPFALVRPFSTVATLSETSSPHQLYKDLYADTSAYAGDYRNYGAYRDVYRLHDSLNDGYAAYTSEFKREPERPVWRYKRNKNKKKSVSTQNMSFGGQDHITVIDHITDSSNLSPTLETIDTPYSSLFKEPIVADYGYSSPEEYYNDMTSKSSSGIEADASNTNFRIVGPPQLGINLHSDSLETTSSETTTPSPTTPASTTTSRPPRRLLRKKLSSSNSEKKQQQQAKSEEHTEEKQKTTSRGRGRFRYGDRLERYDYEDEDSMYI